MRPQLTKEPQASRGAERRNGLKPREEPACWALLTKVQCTVVQTVLLSLEQNGGLPFTIKGLLLLLSGSPQNPYPLPVESDIALVRLQVQLPLPPLSPRTGPASTWDSWHASPCKQSIHRTLKL